MLEKQIEHHLCIGITLNVNNNAHTLSITFFFYIGNTFYALVFDKVGNLLNKFGFVDLIRQFTNNNS